MDSLLAYLDEVESQFPGGGADDGDSYLGPSASVVAAERASDRARPPAPASARVEPSALSEDGDGDVGSTITSARARVIELSVDVKVGARRAVVSRPASHARARRIPNPPL